MESGPKSIEDTTVNEDHEVRENPSKTATSTPEKPNIISKPKIPLVRDMIQNSKQSLPLQPSTTAANLYPQQFLPLQPRAGATFGAPVSQGGGSSFPQYQTLPQYPAPPLYPFLPPQATYPQHPSQSIYPQYNPVSYFPWLPFQQVPPSPPISVEIQLGSSPFSLSQVVSSPAEESRNLKVQIPN